MRLPIRSLFVFLRCVSILTLLFSLRAQGAELPLTIERVKPSVVGIGSAQQTRTPPVTFVGTGFVTGDGHSVITNAHVVKDLINSENSENKEVMGILIGKGESVEFRRASLVAYDVEHDLAHLRVGGTPLPALELGDSEKVMEGQSIAFTGFPLGMVLGLHHVTHRGIISAITPIVMPAMDSRKLDAKMIAQLRRAPVSIFQIDGTAYPGNSGSPLYDPDSGAVLGVINMVMVKSLKESAISAPSGITYAIPAKFIRDLLKR